MILKFKKRRHKPLYKNFIALRKNIQNRKRLDLLKFKKKKWKSLISYLKRLQLRRKKKFRMYDINRYFLPKFFNSFKRKYKYNLQTKKKFKLFYGGLLKNYIKNQVNFTSKQKNKFLKNSINFNSFFLNLLERRLDIVLYRAHFALSVQVARQLISHRHIKVNNKITTDNSYLLKKGDLIKIESSGLKLVEFNIQNSYLWPLPPKYLNINYKILQIIFNNDEVSYQNFSTLFPFQLDLYTIIKYYK